MFSTKVDTVNRCQRTFGSQRGLTFIGFLFNCLLIAVVALIFMRIFPLYNESFKVSAALKSVAEAPGVSQMTARDIQSALLKHLQIDDVTRFDQNNLRNYFIVKPNSGGTRTMTMSYEGRGPLIGNLDIVLKFDESRTIAGVASE